jgi:hemoglobin/transferrin/lactoferrin receptor protein
MILAAMTGAVSDLNHAQTAVPERQLGPVTVTSTRTARPVQDAPSTVTVIDSEQIEKENMRDITDLTRYEPGVSVGNNPGRFGPNSFNIRGIGGNRVLMQVDGIRVSDAFAFGSFGSASRSMIDIDALKSVEILRGPGSTLYGSDAIGGVVSFITKDPSDYMALTDKPVFASAKGGYATADDSWLGTGTVAAGRGDLQGMLLYTYRTGHQTENKGTVGGTGANRTEPNPQSWHDGNVLGKLVYRLNANNQFKLTGEYYKDDTATDVLTLNPQTPTTTTLNGNDEAKRERISIEQEYKNAALSMFQIARWQVYYQYSDTSQATFEQRTNTTAGCSAVTAGTNTCNFNRTFDYSQRVTGFNLQLEKLFESGAWAHHVVYGGDASKTRTSEIRNAVRTNITTGVTTSNIPPDNFPVRDFPESDTILAGAFVQDELRRGSWSFIPGLRYDYYKLKPDPDAIFTADNPGITPVETTDDAFSPKLGVLYRLTPQYTLFGQYAYGYRAPPYNDINIGFTNLAFGYTAIPNPNLKPEKVRGLDLGLRGNFGRSSFSVAGFYNKYTDFISSLQALNCPGDPNCVPGLITFQSVNLSNVRISGFEARGEMPIGNGFGIVGALAYADGEDTDTNQPINSINPPMLVTRLTYDSPGKRWGGQFIGTFVQRKSSSDIDQTTAPVPPSTPGYAVFDLLAYFNISKRSALNIGLFNLADQTYYLWADMQGVGGGTAAIAGPQSIDRFSQPGRNARVTLTLQY